MAAALSTDGMRLYLPLHGGKLLKITAESIEETANGDNEDQFWVEQPFVSGGLPAFEYCRENPEGGLEKFDQLVVSTQSCRVPAMRWLAAASSEPRPFIWTS